MRSTARSASLKQRTWLQARPCLGFLTLPGPEPTFAPGAADDRFQPIPWKKTRSPVQNIDG